MTTPAERSEEVAAYAVARGWATVVRSIVSEDVTDGIYLAGARDEGGRTYGFAIAYALNPDTGRTIVLALDGNPRKRFVMTDGEREWHGPACAWRAAIDRPAWWTHHGEEHG